jgi:hypothetical protein
MLALQVSPPLTIGLDRATNKLSSSEPNLAQI